MKQKIKIKKQYGIVNKEILKNKNITGNAKGLYVYLCARSGNKRVCNPSIATICKDLNISELTFHKLKKELVENNIISIEKKGQGINKRNYYILLKQNDKGYGIVYLDILINPNISLKSKAIYGVLSSFAGMRFVAYPTAKTIYTILKICRNTYFKALKMLKNYSYLITKQLHINGRFSHCNYYINDKEPNKKDTRFIFKGFKKINKTTTTTNNLIKNKNTKITEYEINKNIIMDNIEYEALKGIYSNNKKALYILENILSILANDTYSSNVKNIVVNNIKLYGCSVKAIFNKLIFDNIKYVVDNILNVNNKIKNLRKYLRVALINSFYQLDNKNYNKLTYL